MWLRQSLRPSLSLALLAGRSNIAWNVLPIEWLEERDIGSTGPLALRRSVVQEAFGSVSQREEPDLCTASPEGEANRDVGAAFTEA